MPKPNLNDPKHPDQLDKGDLDSLVSFLLGSVDPQIAAGLHVQAGRTSARRFKRAGGSSRSTTASAATRLISARQTVLQDLPLYQAENKRICRRSLPAKARA